MDLNQFFGINSGKSFESWLWRTGVGFDEKLDSRWATKNQTHTMFVAKFSSNPTPVRQSQLPSKKCFFLKPFLNSGQRELALTRFWNHEVLRKFSNSRQSQLPLVKANSRQTQIPLVKANSRQTQLPSNKPNSRQTQLPSNPTPVERKHAVLFKNGTQKQSYQNALEHHFQGHGAAHIYINIYIYIYI